MSSLAKKTALSAASLAPTPASAYWRGVGAADGVWVGPGWGGALALGAWLGWRRASWGWGAPRYVVAPGFY